jgi:hypothetical protein
MEILLLPCVLLGLMLVVVLFSSRRPAGLGEGEEMAHARALKRRIEAAQESDGL